MNDWVDICWDADDAYNVSDQRHVWGATGCDITMLDKALESIERNCPGAVISLFFDRNGLRQHLAETGRSL